MPDYLSRRVRVVVTGATGGLGRPLVRHLRSLGMNVVAVSRSRPKHGDQDGDFIRADLHDASTDWDEILRGASAVFHLAWSTVPASADRAPSSDLANNVAGTVRLAAAAARQGVKMAFVSSGGTVYGHLLAESADEEHPTQPISFYGLGKLTAENYLKHFAERKDLDLVILRLSNLYGPQETDRRLFGSIPSFVHAMLQEQDINLFGGDQITRDFVHVSDVVKAFSSVLETPSPLVLNIGSGSGSPLKYIVQEIGRITGHTPRLNLHAAREFDVRSSVLDITLARASMGWSPTVGIREGLRDVVASIAPRYM